MAVRPVVALPDMRVKQPSVPVESIDDTARALAVDLIDTMRASPACVGIAAPQIGVHLRAFAMDITGHKKARSCHGEVVLFNPELLAARDPVVAREGCMSVPQLTGDIARASYVVMRGITPEGTERVIQADAFEARALLHEYDHLDGYLFLDRVTSLDAVFHRKVYK